MNRNLSEQIEFVFQELQRLEIEMKAGSRLDQLARVFRAPDGTWTRNVLYSDDSEFEFALEARREFQLFEFILAPWEFGGAKLGREKLRTAVLKDAPLQYDGAKAVTRGRDTQLELYVATAFQRSGAGGQLLANVSGKKSPDVRTRACGRYFFVEAKRVKARSRFVDAVADAVEQVDATGCPGAAFIDVTMAFNEDNRRANENLRRESVHDVIRKWLQGEFEQHRAEVDDVMRGSRLTSLFLQHHALIPLEGEIELRSTILTYPERVTGRYAKADAEIRQSLDCGWTWS
ncbi:MAG: hypothetical protein IPJ77_19030 [Planctomycetes bacterium]|nr:hypothetical protein [Planctomycetota bacterium]